MPLPLITASAEELAALPMKEIKRILTERNISTKDIFEKVRIRFVVAGRKRWVGRRLLHSKRGAAVGGTTATSYRNTVPIRSLRNPV